MSVCVRIDADACSGAAIVLQGAVSGVPYLDMENGDC